MSPAHRPPVALVVSLLLAVPGAVLGAGHYLGSELMELPPPVSALVYGLAIVGAALVLSWAAEAIQKDVNAGIALALLALLAILPEYAVDFVFAVKCGTGGAAEAAQPPEVCSLALANMTGANRVLVGVGWPLVVLVATLAVWWNRRSGKGDGEAASESTKVGAVRLADAMSVEVAVLGLATLYSLTLPLKDRLTLWDSVVFLAIFGFYAWRLTKVPAEEPELVGTSEWVAERESSPRRTLVAALFVVAALVILLSAEQFAESLVSTGEELGVSKFLLVQWVAPLASESPELIVACLYAWRLKASDSLGALLSSKVNQWTLLVGGLPVVVAVAALAVTGLPLDTEQRFELLITAAQSLFAVALLMDRRITFRGALALLALFSVQFLVSVLGSDQANRVTIVALTCVYVVLAVGQLVRRRSAAWELLREGTVEDLRGREEQPEHA